MLISVDFSFLFCYNLVMKEFLEKINASDKEQNFSLYSSLLKEWNEKFNLTSITDEQEIKQKHFIDSLSALPLIKQNATVLDIGSGAGFPGVPLKIIRNDIEVTLIDSVNKKVTFLNEVINRLSLEKIKAQHIRVEDFNKSVKFDVVVSRAVAELRTLLEYALPFVKKGGVFIAYKSEKTDEEIKNAKTALSILGGKINDILDVSQEGNVRKLIVIEKVEESPLKYPRGKNLPRVKPL